MSAPARPFRLTASLIASHFKYRCDRRFRWNAVAEGRGRPGVGWGVPARVRQSTRPGVKELMEGGDRFEREAVEALVATHGDAVVWAGPDPDAPAKVGVLSFEAFLGAMRAPEGLRFVAQPQLELSPAAEARLLARFGLNAAWVALGLSRPDLIELVPADADHPRPRLRVWDFKASREPRHDHFIQVAWYTFLLEAVLTDQGITGVAVDTAFGAVRTRQQVREGDGFVEADPVFELDPYRRAIADFLDRRVPLLLDVRADEAHYHVCDGCLGCEYVDHCRAQADASADLSRIAYLSSESKRRLNAAGLRTHHDLDALSLALDEGDPGAAETFERLRGHSHDLGLHLRRHLDEAAALGDGEPRWLGRPTLALPKYEDVHVVVAAEQDRVSGRCFALGFKTYEGWDATARQVKGVPVRTFLAEHPDDEGRILGDFLTALFDVLDRYDGVNRAIDAEPIPEDEPVRAAEETLAGLKAERAKFVGMRLYPSRRPEDAVLKDLRDGLDAQIKETKALLKRARGDASWARRRRKVSLQFYVYDGYDLRVLREAVERHLFNPETPEPLYRALRHLARLFPPASLLPDSDTFRSLPVTVLVDVLRETVALPVPYGYDLHTVSRQFRPRKADGSLTGRVFSYPYGFGWPHTNGVAFERIHDVWRGEPFVPDPRDPARTLTPEAILGTIRDVIAAKLAATESVARALKAELRARDLLLFDKEPFRLYDLFDPAEPLDAGASRLFDALRVFTVLEESLQELAVKRGHLAPPEDRAARFEALHGMRFEAEEPDGTLRFSFHPDARDTKLEAGDFNLVLTNEDDPAQLLHDVDGPLFRPAAWRGGHAKVTLERIRPHTTPPLVWVRPAQPDRLREKVDLGRPCVLDRIYNDYNSPKVLAALARLRAGRPGDGADHVRTLVELGTLPAWRPFLHGAARHYATLEALAQGAGGGDGAPRALLNVGQRHAFTGAFEAPLALVWGPPGTGKTHVLAHVLLAYALAAREARQAGKTTGPLRVMVTAFTHHAIANVLAKAAELADTYGLGEDLIAIAKIAAHGDNAADTGLPASVLRLRNEKTTLAALGAAPGVLVVGATVWAASKLAATWRKAQEAPAAGPDASGDDGADPEAAEAAPLGPPVAPLFDVVLVDEASQMKVPEAILALTLLRPGGSVLLAGDDRQLPPIVHGTYPDEHAHLLTSIFAFMRHRAEARQAAGEAGAVARTLFPLTENFRMNEPLTAYPRAVLYGEYTSTRPGIRITLDGAGDDNALLAALLDPLRPVVLVRYAPPRAYTARNPLEADLAARLVAALGVRLVDPETGGVYLPDRLAAEGVACVAPHRAQNAAIRAALRGLGYGVEDEEGTIARPLPLVDTVDKLQGKERDVVVVSYGVADDEYAEAEAGFLLSRNRFNVAVTRARRKVIVLVADPVVDTVPADRRVLLDAMMLKEFGRYCDDGEEAIEIEAEGQTVTLRLRWKGFGEEGA